MKNNHGTTESDFGWHRSPNRRMAGGSARRGQRDFYRRDATDGDKTHPRWNESRRFKNSQPGIERAALCLQNFRSLSLGAEGQYFRFNSHNGRRSLLPISQESRPRSRRGWVYDHHGRRTRDYASGSRRGRSGKELRSQYPFAVYPEGQSIYPRRPQTDDLSFLFYAQVDVRQRSRCVYFFSRWIWDARRTDRSADVGADRQEPTGADYSHGPARQQLLGRMGRVCTPCDIEPRLYF